jgi:hypothetical protein
MTRNLFLALGETIAQSLKVSFCYVCGGTVMEDQWPWEFPQTLHWDRIPPSGYWGLSSKNFNYWKELSCLMRRLI